MIKCKIEIEISDKAGNDRRNKITALNVNLEGDANIYDHTALFTALERVKSETVPNIVNSLCKHIIDTRGIEALVKVRDYMQQIEQVTLVNLKFEGNEL